MTAGRLLVGTPARRKEKQLCCRLTPRGAVSQHVAEQLHDPQTSGGMLISIAPEDTENLMAELEAAEILFSKIGKVTAPKSPQIYVY